MKEKPFIIGIGGGTGSGKSTLAKALQAALTDTILISMDDYYRDQRDIPVAARAAVNYDHPSSIEVSLLLTHLQLLQAGSTVEKPNYDFENHTRKDAPTIIDPVGWIIVEGILTLSYEELLNLFDMTIYVDAKEDLRFNRRLERDVKERQRTHAFVLKQYKATVKPMHVEFVEPTKDRADYIVSGETDTNETVSNLITKIKYNKLKKSST